MGDTEDLANLAKPPQFSAWKLWDRRKGTVIAHQRALNRKGMGQYGEHVAHTLMSAATMAEMLQRSSQNQRSNSGEQRSKTAHQLGRCCLPPCDIS